MMLVRMRWIAITIMILIAGLLLLPWAWERKQHRSAQVSGDKRVPIAGAAGPLVHRVPAKPPAPAGKTTAPEDPDLAACHRDHMSAIQRRAAMLEAADGGREQLAYALLSQVLPGDDDPRKRERAFAAAIDRSGEDTLVAWVAVQHCKGDQCDSQSAVAALLRLEPDNAAAWLPAMDAEVRRGDLMQADRLLFQAARAGHFNAYWDDTGRLLAKAIGPLPQTPACERAGASIAKELSLDRPGTIDDLTMVTSTAVASAALPALNGILKLCPPSRGIARHRLVACRAMFLRMAKSDELLFNMVGARGMAMHGASPAERVQWSERLRNIEWLQRQAGALMKPSHIPLVWELGEVSVLTALLEEAGRWPAPPDWQPTD